jgi:hypothetical protein
VSRGPAFAKAAARQADVRCQMSAGKVWEGPTGRDLPIISNRVSAAFTLLAPNRRLLTSGFRLRSPTSFHAQPS